MRQLKEQAGIHPLRSAPDSPVHRVMAGSCSLPSFPFQPGRGWLHPAAPAPTEADQDSSGTQQDDSPNPGKPEAGACPLGLP